MNLDDTVAALVAERTQELTKDLAECKQTKEALRESEERYRLLVEQSPDIIGILQEGRLVFINHAGALQIGAKTVAELLGWKPEDIVHPEDLSGALARMERLLRGETGLYPAEVRYVRLDGTTLPAEVSATSTIFHGKIAVQFIARDITERKRGEEALAEQADFSERVFNSTDAHLAVVASDGAILAVNAAWRRFAEENIGGDQRAWGVGASYFVPFAKQWGDTALAAEAFEGVRKVQRGLLPSFGLEYPCYGPGDVTHWFVMRVLPLHGKDGTVLVSHVNITELKQAVEVLRESENALKESQLIAGLGSYVLNIPTGMWRSSDVLDTLFGIDGTYKRSVEGWLALVHPDDRARMADYFGKEVLGHGRAFDREYRIVRRDNGAERWVHGLGKLGFDQDGHLLKMHGTIQDVTERKRAEEALRESEERFRSLSNASLEAIMIHDQGVILNANRAFARLFGYEREEELIGRTGMELLLTPESQARIRQRIELQEKGPLEVTGVRKDRSTFLAETEAQPLSYRGRDARIVSCRDISERKRAEAERERLQEQLIQAQKMDAIGRLAGGVAHDFNNMVQVIVGHVDMALEVTLQGNPVRENLEEIQKAARRSAELTQQLLAFARKQTIAPKVVDLNEIVEGVLKMLSRLIGENIQLAWAATPGLGLVKVDPTQVHQILANLCLNARDAIGGTGKVGIEAVNVTVDADRSADHLEVAPGEYVCLTVSDDGCGMDKHTALHLFEPFFTTKGVGHGTGLGLAIVYGIVKQNHGFIQVNTELGEGTTFRIYLPRHVGQRAGSRTEASREVSKSRGETLLLVEDELAILGMAQGALERLGYSVLAASTPREAIGLAEAHTREIHLLVSDVVMPEMNGWDLSRRLLSHRPKLKCLFMSGYTADVVALYGVPAEGAQFIPKPFSVEELASKVREALELQ